MTTTSTPSLPTRRPLQGVANVVRFNWPTYVAAGVAAVLGFGATAWLYASGQLSWAAAAATATLAGLATVVGSLIATYWVYDASELYALTWLGPLEHDGLLPAAPERIANVNAGFDEFSGLLSRHYPAAELDVFDFYDEHVHTEASIARARMRYPAYPGTITTTTAGLPRAAATDYDLVLAAFSLHEIRDTPERAGFLRSLGEALSERGRLIIVEHLVDLPNTLAYTVGVGHFHARSTWLAGFAEAGLRLLAERRITPLVRVFVLAKPSAR